MEAEPPRRMSFGRIALHYTTKPFSQAQDKVQKATRTATHALGSQITKPKPSQPSSPRKSSLIPTTSSSITNSTTPQPLTHFRLFPQLPAELRLQIWQHTLPGPRVLQIHEGKPRQGKLVSRQLILPWVSPIPIPKLLHICAESRQEGLRHYTLAFGKPNIHPPRIYIDFTTDTIYFGRRDNASTLVSVIGLLDSPSLNLSDFQSSPSFLQIRKLALIPKGVLDLVEWDWNLLSRTSLTDLYVVNQMTTGRSFRVGKSPNLQVTSPSIRERQENASTARAVAAKIKAAERLKLRSVGTEREKNGLRLPVVRTVEFVFAEGDEWVGPDRLRGLSGAGAGAGPAVGGTADFFVV